jgi:hypothetical protein
VFCNAKACLSEGDDGATAKGCLFALQSNTKLQNCHRSLHVIPLALPYLIKPQLGYVLLHPCFYQLLYGKSVMLLEGLVVRRPATCNGCERCHPLCAAGSDNLRPSLSLSSTSSRLPHWTIMAFDLTISILLCASSFSNRWMVFAVLAYVGDSQYKPSF